ncbi:methyl-accepting chemotaxis sensory transducer [Natronorubrum sulfidifaciens JCM 14089]|uniref:Methyl-accepting chemotaxis sensory transducer n=1 Tax=Natronorubrum sulfidifaciens JCM 14089 TaxID=1230460 RepID=L9W0Q4_9EURY|nr:methyl-accepting chemotaxis sensory transducer [Natronorubrum sulfidifaciens JCM 14089]
MGYSSGVDATELVDRIGLSENEIEWRKQFIEFSDDDVERLRRYEETFTRRGDDVADMFYEKIEDNPQVLEILDRSPRSIEQLKWSQQMYLVTLATGSYDQEYFQNRARIGKLHDMLEMPVKHYIGQYGIYYNLLLPIISEQIQDDISAAIREAIERQSELRDDEDVSGGRLSSLLGRGGDDGDDDEAFETTIAELEDELSVRIDERIDELHSLLKIINLDMQVAIDTYIDSYANVEELLDHQQDVTNRVSHALQDISMAGEAIATSVDDISTSVTEQSQQTRQASSEMQDISASVEELSTTTDTIAGRDDELLNAVESSEDHCEQATESVVELRESEADIREEVDAFKSIVAEIETLNDEIADTAEKTRMVAVNANVESKRSGETGNFNVVADQFQELSEQMTRRTKQIDERVETLRKRAEETLSSIEANQQRVDTSQQELSELTDDLGDVRESTSEFMLDVDELSSLIDAQASSTQEMATRIETIDDEAQSINNDVETVTGEIEEQFSKVEMIESVLTELSEESQQQTVRYDQQTG